MKHLPLVWLILTFTVAHASDQTDQDSSQHKAKEKKPVATADAERPTYQSPSYAGVVNIHGLVDAGTPTPRPHQHIVGTQSDDSDTPKPPGYGDGRR